MTKPNTKIKKNFYRTNVAFFKKAERKIRKLREIFPFSKLVNGAIIAFDKLSDAEQIAAIKEACEIENKNESV